MACANMHASCQGHVTYAACRHWLLQVLEILSHVNKRTRAAPTVRLPLQELAALYAGGGAAWQLWARRATQPPLPIQELLAHKCPHPLPSFWALWRAAPNSSPMARSFAVVYLEQAVARAPPAERLEQARRGRPGRGLHLGAQLQWTGTRN